VSQETWRLFQKEAKIDYFFAESSYDLPNL